MPPKGFFDDSDSDGGASDVDVAEPSTADATRHNASTSYASTSPRAQRGTDSYADRSSYRASSVATDSNRDRPAPKGRARERDLRERDADGDVSLDDILGQGKGAEQERNIERLIRAWNDEIGAPELLIFPRELVETIVKDLARRRAMVKQAMGLKKRDEAFYVQATLAATENMRASHVLKSYTRLRIHKVEKFAWYYLHELAEIQIKDEQNEFLTEEEEDTKNSRLYHNELAHARGYMELVDRYYRNNAVDALPARVQERMKDISIYPAPDFTQAVFVRARRKCPPIVLPNGELLEMLKDDQHMLRYSSVRALLKQGAIELL